MKDDNVSDRGELCVAKSKEAQSKEARGIKLNEEHQGLTRGELDRIIMMAWEDRTSFDAIRIQFGLSPGEVVKLMRKEMTVTSFKMWRVRTQGRVTKHETKFAQANPRTSRRFRAKSQRG